MNLADPSMLINMQRLGMGSNQDFANASWIELGTANASRIKKLQFVNQLASRGQTRTDFVRRPAARKLIQREREIRKKWKIEQKDFFAKLLNFITFQNWLNFTTNNAKLGHILKWDEFPSWQPTENCGTFFSWEKNLGNIATPQPTPPQNAVFHSAKYCSL